MEEKFMMENKLNLKRILLIIFIVSLMIRLLYGIFVFNKGETIDFKGDNDHWEYINYAKNIIDQGIFVPDITKLDKEMETPYGLRGGEASLVGPGYPLVIAAIFALFGENNISFTVLIILNAILSALLCVLIFYIGKELFNEKVGLWAAIWSIFYISYIKYIPSLYKDTWITLFFPLLIYLFIKETKRNKVSLSLILLAIFYAYFIHLDERFFIYFPILLAGFVFFDTHSWRKGLQKAFVFSSFVVILMVPWLIRNFNVYHRVVILTERTARFTDQIFGYREEVVKRNNEEEKEVALKEDVAKMILAGKEVPADIVNAIENSRRLDWLEPLKKGIKHGYIPHRYSSLEKWFANAGELWRPFLLSGAFVSEGFQFVGPSWSFKHNLISCLSYGWLLPFFLAGIIFSLKNKNKYAIFIVLIMVLHTFIHVILPYITDRYRIPMDAFVMVTAFYGLQQVYLEFLNRGRMYKITS
ncbi:MAG TPA: glycosyltransferase family 39 protein [Candidatus Deferrimicrobium sp.]|nr:glycosyltransferase family 39 protein [Candidatus Deferrimicrobium sp.]